MVRKTINLDSINRRIKKLEPYSFSLDVPIPQEIIEWHKNQTSDEVTACLAYHSILENERPADMLNPSDVINKRLPAIAIKWANQYLHKAKIVWEREGENAPSWSLFVMIIMEYDKRRRAGVAHDIAEGEPPLHWSDFTDERVYARPPGYQVSLEPTSNYRRVSIFQNAN